MDKVFDTLYDLFEHCDMHDLATLTKDMIDDDPDFEDYSVNDMDRVDMVTTISEFVQEGIDHKLWTLESWIAETKEDFEL